MCRPASKQFRDVVRVQDCWRIDDEWWRERPISRLYYVLLLDNGEQVTVFHDLIECTWCEQRAGRLNQTEGKTDHY